MSFFKALIPASLLTWIVARIVGPQGSTGGVLYIHMEHVKGHDFYWSWPLFFASLILAWALFAMTPK